MLNNYISCLKPMQTKLTGSIEWCGPPSGLYCLSVYTHNCLPNLYIALPAYLSINNNCWIITFLIRASLGLGMCTVELSWGYFLPPLFHHLLIYLLLFITTGSILVHWAATPLVINPLLVVYLEENKGLTFLLCVGYIYICICLVTIINMLINCLCWDSSTSYVQYI